MILIMVQYGGLKIKLADFIYMERTYYHSIKPIIEGSN